jgi:predicted dehydrogenase
VSGCGVIERRLQVDFPAQGAVVVTGGWHHRKSYPFSAEFTVVAEGGTLDFAWPGRPLTLHRADGEAEPLPVASRDPYQAEIEYFLDCCRRGQAPELCPPRDSARAVDLTLRMVEARARRGARTPVTL